MKKYELLVNDTINVEGRTLYRIKALIDFGYVKAGELGGYIEKESNLSHEGNCWVSGNAQVYGYAWVSGNAWVYDNAKVYGKAMAYGDAWVFGDAWVYDNAQVYGNAMVYGNVRVFGNAQVYGNAWAYDNAHVCGNVRVCRNAIICNNAYISSNDDYAYIHGFGSKNRTTAFFRTKDGSIDVKCGCFSGTLDEFRNKVKETHGDNKYAQQYNLAIQLIECKFEIGGK